MMSPVVRVDDEVYRVLQKNAVPFLDTPNTVLRRLLALEPVSGNTPPISHSAQRRAQRALAGVDRAPRAASADLLPASEYERPILLALSKRGGSAAPSVIVEAVGKALDSRLTPTDRETLASGVVRWQNRVQWVRFRLVKKSLMDNSTPRGTWSLTQAGLDAARDLVDETGFEPES